MNDIAMTSNKPYLIRALHEWISDNGCTPYLYIDTGVNNLEVPEHLLTDNPLVLNASVNACKDLQINDNDITFQARFSGQVHDVYLPMVAIIAIVARENGQGMTFEWQTPDAIDESDKDASSNNSDKPVQNKPKGGLKVVR